MPKRVDVRQVWYGVYDVTDVWGGGFLVTGNREEVHTWLARNGYHRVSGDPQYLEGGYDRAA